MPSPLALALYQPDIALNTGTMLRLGACLGVPVHVVHPTGFPFSRAALKRSGLDYLDRAEIVEHSGFAAFSDWRSKEGRRLVLLSSKAQTRLDAAAFCDGDVLMVGRESAGVPEAVAQNADLALRIPMREGLRSLNVALAAAMALGEALRQTGQFPA